MKPGDKLLELMKLYFGSLGPTLLEKSLKQLNIDSIDSATEKQKTDLVNLLLDDCFSSIMSYQKLKFIMSELISALNIKRSRFARGLNTSVYDTTGVR